MFQQIVEGERAVANYIRRLVAINREFIGEETFEVRSLLGLIGKRWYCGRQWTKEELKELKVHFLKAAKIVYAFIIFLLPGGLFLLPFVAEWLHKPKG